MIPKRLIYCNFGHMKFREHVEKACMKTLEEHFPKSEWEWLELNENTFDVNAHEFTRIAYKKGLYSYVSDYARTYTLRKLGGVYVDLDLYMLRDLPEEMLIHNRMFIGSAKTPFYCKKNTDVISWGIVGCEPENPFMQELEYLLDNNASEDMNKEDVIVMNGTLELIRLLEQCRDIDMLKIDKPLHLPHMTIYPFDVLTCTFWTTTQSLITTNSVCVHLYGGSWLDFGLYTLQSRIDALKKVNRQQHVVIVEGVDKTGKTTLCQMLRKRLNIDVYKRPSDGFDFTRLECGGVGLETCKLLSHLQKTGESIVFDRLHLSEYVYGKLNRNYNETDNKNWFDAMELFMRGMNVTLILVLPDDVKWSSEQHGSDLSEYVGEFKRIFEKSKIAKRRVVHFSEFKGSFESIIDYIYKETVS